MNASLLHNFLQKTLLEMGNINSTYKLSQEDLEFLATETGQCKEELYESYENFICQYPDGKISKETFQKCFPYGDAEVKEHYFRIYDSNGDGLIDFKEFMMTYYLTHMGTPEQMFQKIFRFYDVNNDKKVSKDELTKVLQDRLNFTRSGDKTITGEDIVQLTFSNIDTDDNGLITEEEFVKACLDNKEISNLLVIAK